MVLLYDAVQVLDLTHDNPLKPEQFGLRFGPTDADSLRRDFEAVERWPASSEQSVSSNIFAVDLISEIRIPM